MITRLARCGNVCFRRSKGQVISSLIEKVDRNVAGVAALGGNEKAVAGRDHCFVS
jgi:hypothetical protein